MNQKNIVPIYFPKEAQEAILNLADQYQINLKDEDFYDFSKEGPEVLIFNLAKRITNRAGKFKDISQILQKELNMSPENAAKLALDIKDKIVPLAEIIEPEKKENISNYKIPDPN